MARRVAPGSTGLATGESQRRLVFGPCCWRVGEVLLAWMSGWGFRPCIVDAKRGGVNDVRGFESCVS